MRSGIVLEKEQKRAVEHGKGPLMVLAGPGSGKTAVLTHRVDHLVREAGVPERNILVLTFTRAAAQEMRSRYLGLSGKQSTAAVFGTFHSVFYSFLRRNPAFAGYRAASRQECERLLEELLLPRFGESTAAQLAEPVCSLIGKLKNGMRVTEPLAAEMAGPLAESMRQRKLMDFDDMLLLFLRLLLDDPALVSGLRQRFRYVLVDEFQDINRVQFEILKILAGESRNIFAVGDDDQSIYGFRGSDPLLMKRFCREFGAKTLLLPVNHRSSETVVRTAGRLIRHNRFRFRKRIRALHRGGPAVEIRGFTDLPAEAAGMEERILALRRAALAAGHPAPRTALLTRTRAAGVQLAGLLSEETRAGLSVLTFHASKGLEFDCVFLAAANEEITPGRRAAEDEGLLEEERRAFYVAVTRCRSLLHIFYTNAYYNKPVRVSRFVKELQNPLPVRLPLFCTAGRRSLRLPGTAEESDRVLVKERKKQ